MASPSRRLCESCEGAAKWFQDLEEAKKPASERPKYVHKPSYQDLSKSAQVGCALCDLLCYDICIFAVRCADRWDIINVEDEAPNIDTFLTTRTSPTAIELSCNAIDVESFVWINWSVGDTHITGTLDVHFDPAELETLRRYHDLGSQGALELAKTWIERCTGGHTACAGAASVPFIPTRLLDVSASTPHLITTAELTAAPSYVALSYCWGLSMPETSKTTNETLSAHYEAVPLDRMPRTLRDAIEVTRTFGVQYIWIDSLCIIQDDAEDWRREAEMMGDVYSNAYLTLAAASSDHCDGGMFHKLDPRRHLRVELSPGRIVESCKLLHTDVLSGSALGRRAWALQERELSPRILWFTSQGFVFECRGGYETEAFMPSDTWIVEMYYPPVRILDVVPISEEDAGDHTRAWFDKWRQLASNYSSRLLTKETDRLAAMHGLAEMVRGRTGSEYTAGIMHDDVLRQLCWFKSDQQDYLEQHESVQSKDSSSNAEARSERLSRPWTYRNAVIDTNIDEQNGRLHRYERLIDGIPSWSWPFVAGPVAFWSRKFWEFEPEEQNLTATDVVFEDAKSAAGFQHKLLKITAWIGSLADWLSCPEHTLKEPWNSSSLRWDKKSYEEELQDVKILTLLRFRKVTHGGEKYTGLLVVSFGDFLYRRVGLVIEVEQSWILRGEMQTITLA